MARPRPRDEPVTSAVRPVRSNRAGGMRSSGLRAADGEVGALEDCRQKLDAEARPFHRVDVAVLDHRHLGDELLVPAGVEGAHASWISVFGWLNEAWMPAMKPTGPMQSCGAKGR